MEKTFHIAKSSSGSGFNLISGSEKVSESIFNDLLTAKIKELLGDDRATKFDECFKEVMAALESKKPVTILDRNFEIKFKKIKRPAFPADR